MLYEFSYARLSGPIQSFSFSLTSPSFLADGYLSLTPFWATDGANSWTISQGYATVKDVFGNGCIVVGTADADLGSCYAGLSASDGGILFLVWSGKGLPSSESLYAPTFFSGQFYAAGEYVGSFPTISPSTGSLRMNISQTSSAPEPASLTLVVTALATLGVWRSTRWRSRKKLPRAG